MVLRDAHGVGMTGLAVEPSKRRVEKRGASIRRGSRRDPWGFYLSLFLGAVIVAVLETAVDPLAAWERCVEVLFGLGIPVAALKSSLDFYRVLENPSDPHALLARHGADRRHILTGVGIQTLACAILWFGLALVACRALSHSALETTFNQDSLRCFGIGCLATAAYIAFLLAATRVGVGRWGAWVAMGLDLTLGHIEMASAAAFPHRHVANLIGHPNATFLSASASSWILLGFVAVGLSVVYLRTPR